MVKIADLTIDSEIQLESRGTDTDTVGGYVEAISSGAKFPPITVFSDNGTLWLSNGFHRVEACRFLGLAEIEADVRLGNRKDAMVHAAIANVENGLPMSQTQKREAGERLLKLTDWSNREIARRLAVSHDSVNRWTNEVSGRNRPDTRTVTRGSTTYTMDVSSIGKTAQESSADKVEWYQQWARDNESIGLDEFGDPLPQERNHPHVSYNAGDNEWYTPQEYIGAACQVMGDIDLDPASTQEANAIVGADKFYSPEDNGLVQDWHGKVWMNPPYAQPLVGQFTDKLVLHVQAGDVTEAIVLVNNATETQWFGRLIGIAGAVCFPSGRVKFWAPDGKIAAPLQGQAIIYIGSNTDAFVKQFRRFGWLAIVSRGN